MSKRTNERVLGRVLARDLTEREAASVGGAHGESGGGGTGSTSCNYPTFISDVFADGTFFCDPQGSQIP